MFLRNEKPLSNLFPEEPLPVNARNWSRLYCWLENLCLSIRLSLWRQYRHPEWAIALTFLHSDANGCGNKICLPLSCITPIRGIRRASCPLSWLYRRDFCNSRFEGVPLDSFRPKWSSVYRFNGKIERFSSFAEFDRFDSRDIGLNLGEGGMKSVHERGCALPSRGISILKLVGQIYM